MKRLIAILFALIYFTFFSGTILADTYTIGNTITYFAGETEHNSSEKETGDNEFHTVQFIASAKHIAASVKIKILRPGIAVNSTGSNAFAGILPAIKLPYVSKAGICKIPLHLINCVFRI